MMKTQTPSGASNPLARIALEAPALFGPAISIGARGVGAALALYIAQDQSYDRTQVFAAGLVVVAVLSVVPMPRGIGGFASALAAGALFFGGAMLWDQAAGIAMLIAGAAAACGALIANHRAGASPAAGVAGFFIGLGLDVAGVVAIALTVEG